MTYNRFLYNSALWNAGRDEVGAVARSLIQAHTGPHIQAVVGQEGGVSFISDFVITEGTLTKPPAAFHFPDLAARIRATQRATDDLAAFIRGFAFKDLQGLISLVAKLPDLPAAIFGLLQQDLGAEIIGELGMEDLQALLFVAVAHLGGHIAGLDAPILQAIISGHSPKDLGAIIWAPQDLQGLISSVQFYDLPADINSLSFKNLGGQMLGLAAPRLNAFVRGFASAVDDLPVYTIGQTAGSSDLAAELISSLVGFRTTLPALIVAGALNNLPAQLQAVIPSQQDLGAIIAQFSQGDLGAIIEFLGANNLPANVGLIPFGQRNRELPALLQPVTYADLMAEILVNANLKNLSAYIESLHDTKDLRAFVRAAETFITTIFTIVTMSAHNLRATIGNPGCAGGSAFKALPALAIAQQAKNLAGYIESFANKELAAVINTNTIVHAFDLIDVFYTRRRVRNKKFFAVDTIDVVYSPFNGRSLLAAITGTLPEKNLAATITAAFLLPKVSPNIGRVTAADLRLGEDVNIQEVRLQMEGALTEFFYVHGTQQAFIKDATQQWRINIRSFKPIAEQLFGDFSAARICRLGSLTSFVSIDEAVRFCISAVLGLQGQQTLAASINAAGAISQLQAQLQVINNYQDLQGIANRVFPSDLLNASITSTGGYEDLFVSIIGAGSGSGNLNAAIDPFGISEMSAEIVGV